MSLRNPIDQEARMATLNERFEAFNRDNPHVYDALKALAFKALDAGQTKLGIAQLFEVCRWELLLSSTESAPHLNNDYRAGYARLLMEREPRLAGRFETRRSAVDSSSAPHSPEPGPPPAEGPSVAAGSGQPAATPSSDRRLFSPCGRNGGSDVEGDPRAAASGLPSEPHPSSLFEVEPCGPAWNDPTNPCSEAA